MKVNLIQLVAIYYISYTGKSFAALICAYTGSPACLTFSAASGAVYGGMTAVAAAAYRGASGTEQRAAWAPGAARGASESVAWSTVGLLAGDAIRESMLDDLEVEAEVVEFALDAVLGD
jgi:hypothetical protein